MEQEVAEAPERLDAQRQANAGQVARLAEGLRRTRPRFVLTGARGSSDHAAAFMKYLIETRLGLAVASAAPSVATLYGRSLDLDGALFVAISQSGRSPDLLKQTEAAKAGGARTLAIVNDVESPLAGLADDVLPIGAGVERSVAATKSYICTLGAAIQLVAAWGGDADLTAAHGRLPDRVRAALDADWSAGETFLRPLAHMLVVGRGFGFAIALEAALKLKETCVLQAEAFSAAELMHGPLALARDGFPVLVLNPDDLTSANTTELVRILRDKGARVLVAEPGEPVEGRLALPAPDHPVTDGITVIAPFYRMAARTAIARGFDPDNPQNLKKVTETR